MFLQTVLGSASIFVRSALGRLQGAYVNAVPILFEDTSTLHKSTYPDATIAVQPGRLVVVGGVERGTALCERTLASKGATSASSTITRENGTIMEIAAACVAFVEFSYRLTAAATKYTKSVKNSPHSLDAFLKELHRTQDTLQKITELCQRKPDVGHDGLVAVVKDCQAELSKLLPLLEKSLSPSKTQQTRTGRVSAGFRRLAWPLKESEIKAYLDVVHGFYRQISMELTRITKYRPSWIEF